ncbi:immune inhibitor A domain-containing protein [Intrasporangium calvum]|uniref:M6 family metalloprotease domain protein n=1 Tax=Intrasporangium calvum (strain ATCC 23552 / DSM 43043 / JCM 3097 / NBRC 12989 / NCIMB 10167 / NRRL B-3866 / 7 KIP) TaxID=710696 RepID=E6SCG5_INTC7|nr:immune inhibitor A domain-containing protein [Intrasporangium calvum]ADU48544.1 M6 family metalloprotease domain protein [Intrasporangium calvum DSM 43043]
MNKRQWSAVSGLAVGALVATALAAPGQAQATPQAGSVISSDPAEAQSSRPDNLPNPLGDAAADRRKDAVEKLIKGKASTRTINGRRVIEVKSANGQSKYVDYPVNREESVFTILAEFGDQIHSATGGTAGPARNKIPEPDRNWDGSATDDNSTYWIADFDRAHYLDLMFGDGESFKDFYLKQSNGRFLAKGDVSDWVKVPYNEARYGSNKYGGSSTYWPFVRDTATAWYEAQVASGKSPAAIKEYLSQFDRVDRYDYDGDGDFLEPDGYIDHFQAIHAGEGEEAGGGAQGTDAIWSHRWYAYSNQIGKAGPDINKAGGVPIGDTGIWIGDYTTEPENGGLGVFAHEFGHDLGLPDLYDTAGGDNTTGFWTLMSGGSWLNRGGDSIGTTPGYMGPWEKLQLGWLDYTVVPFGEDEAVTLTRADKGAAKRTQAAIVTLPDKTVTTGYNTPHSGAYEWWGGSADDLQNTLTRTVDLTGMSSASLSAWVEYQIEEGYDYLYTEVSTDGGLNWITVGTPIDGESTWTEKSWDLSPYAGKVIEVRFRYATDGGLHYDGPFLDDIAIAANGATLLSDDVESGDNGWTAKGFTRMTGSTSKVVAHYYLAENRTYTGYDATLKTGPYNFGFGNTRPDFVERFPYQNGMLVWYADGAYSDNNTSTHPGGGQALPVDARPAPVTFYDGSRLGNRRQPFDATFGLEATDAVTFHKNGIATEVPSSAAMPTFDDSVVERYWDASNPWASTKVAGSGTTLTVVRSEDGGNELEVQVSFK